MPHRPRISDSLPVRARPDCVITKVRAAEASAGPISWPFATQKTDTRALPGGASNGTVSPALQAPLEFGSTYAFVRTVALRESTMYTVAWAAVPVGSVHGVTDRMVTSVPGGPDDLPIENVATAA